MHKICINKIKVLILDMLSSSRKKKRYYNIYSFDIYNGNLHPWLRKYNALKIEVSYIIISTNFEGFISTNA